MIEKLLKNINKIFAPKEESKKVQKKSSSTTKSQPQHLGTPAPVLMPIDPWFSDPDVKPVKTEKQITHEEMLEEASRREAENNKSKESDDIHQKLYEMATKSWGSWQENIGGSENFQEGTGEWNSGSGLVQFNTNK